MEFCSFLRAIMISHLLQSLSRIVIGMLFFCSTLVAQDAFNNFAGTYQGLLVENPAGAPLGRVDFTVTSKGALSGALLLKDQKSYKFKSTLSLNAIDNTAGLTNFDVVKPKEGLELKLSLEIALNGSFTVIGNALLPSLTAGFVEAENSTARLRLYKAKTDECPWAGTYTMAFQYTSNNGVTTPPGGTSIGSATIKTDGVMSAKGTLADGTKFTISARPSEDGTYRVFFGPHKTVGSYFTTLFRLSPRSDGWFHVAEGQSTARWVKSPNSKDKSYRDGFDADLNTSVVQWKPPGKGEALRDVLGLGASNIIDIDFFNGLSPSTYANFLPTSIGLNSNNTFRIASALGGPPISDEKSWAKICSGKVDPKTGLITITINITDTVAGKTIKRKVVVNGAFVQLDSDLLDQPYAFGHLIIPPLDAKTGTLTSGGFDLPGPIAVDELLAATGNTAGTYSAVLTMLPNPTPLPTGAPANGATVNFTVSNNLSELTFNGRKVTLIGDSRPVSLVYSDATKSPTNNLTVTLYLNGSGVVQSLATQYFQVSYPTIKIRNHTSNTIRKN